MNEQDLILRKFIQRDCKKNAFNKAAPHSYNKVDTKIILFLMDVRFVYAKKKQQACIDRN